LRQRAALCLWDKHGATILPFPSRIIIATRESALALWQAHHVRDLLVSLYPGLDVEILGLTTQGDRELSTSLAKIGGKGLFVKELEIALAEGRADIAVHSMKDVPAEVPEHFRLAAICEREDPRDAFVSNRYRDLSAVLPGAAIGTSSLRRASQIRARQPRLSVEPLRGNVHTRLRRLDEGRYAAIILAAAGLKRLGLETRITTMLDPDESLPAAGQGALGIECRADRDDLLELLTPIAHSQTAWCVHAERAVTRALAGNCVSPIGAFAESAAAGVRLRAFVASPDGVRFASADVTASDRTGAPEDLGVRAAQQLLDNGAASILADIANG
jgi:hydroxymethylbilane synthase